MQLKTRGFETKVRRYRVGRQKIPAVLPEGPHPIPSRTRKLRPPGPMVLQGKLCGRVGRRRELFGSPRASRCWLGGFFLPEALPSLALGFPMICMSCHLAPPGPRGAQLARLKSKALWSRACSPVLSCRNCRARGVQRWWRSACSAGGGRRSGCGRFWPWRWLAAPVRPARSPQAVPATSSSPPHRGYVGQLARAAPTVHR